MRRSLLKHSVGLALTVSFGALVGASCGDSPQDGLGGAGGASSTHASTSKATSGTNSASSSGTGFSTSSTTTSASSSDASSASSSDASSSVSSSDASSSASTTVSSSASTTVSSSASTTVSSSASTTAASSSSTGGGSNCTEITATNIHAVYLPNADAWVYRTVITPNVEGPQSDVLDIEFYAASNGTFNLATGVESNYSTCEHCVLTFADALATPNGGPIFFQSGGTFTINATSNTPNGTLNGTLTDVTLIEVTINGTTFVSTPVPGGACLHIASATIAAAPPVAPAAWDCDPDYYGDGSCDCGCGVYDPDCLDASVGACEYCADTGSCSSTDCPGTINASNNAICP